MPLLTKPHSVLSPGEAIDGDVRCQSCIQSSTTLAHACLLIRRGDTALAGHVLEALEQAKNSPFRDVIAYFRAWIEMETRAFARAKSDLLSHLQQQPGDSVALSLLQACMVLELRERGALSPGTESAAAPPVPPSTPDLRAADIAELAPLPEPESPVAAPSLSPVPDSEMEPYQAAASDPQTAFALWSSAGFRALGNRDLIPLAELLPANFPGTLTDAVARLEGGSIQKICFAFQNTTLATWHGSGKNVGLIAGPIQQALLAMTRVEKTFLKHSARPAP